MRLKDGIAIAGSHGKTTTTSLIATVLAHAELDPTAVVGGKLNALGIERQLGKGELIVVGGRRERRLLPAPLPDHRDRHERRPRAPRSLRHVSRRLQQAFVDFADRVPFYGLAVLCVDHPVVQAPDPAHRQAARTYGISTQAEWRADNVRHGLPRASPSRATGKEQGEVTSLPMVGAHNVLNALACCAVADELGIPFETSRSARRSSTACSGASPCAARRRASPSSTTTATIRRRSGPRSRARAPASAPAHRRAFQPHRYTRTRDLLGEFATAFNDADA